MHFQWAVQVPHASKLKSLRPGASNCSVHRQHRLHIRQFRLPPVAAAAAAALNQQQVALKLQQPPPEYDYKAEILPETLDVVSQHYPQLMDIVQAGNLVVYRRPVSYTERRSDGYQEPQLIFILGTAHVSQQSAAEVARLIAAVQPDAVVVELCKSRTAVLHTAQDQQQQQQQQQLVQQQQEQQQRWQQQWQDWQEWRSQQQGPRTAVPAPAAFSSVSSSIDEDAQVQQAATAQHTNSATPSSSSSSSSSNGAGSTGKGVWQQLQASMQRSQSAKASNPLSLSGADPLSALARSASLGGQQAMLLRLLIAGQARKAADQLGVQPGAEFRAAAEAAAEVPGGQCCLVLGDRPIEITLSRAWEALTWRRRLQLLVDLLSAGMTSSSHQAVLSQEQVESLRSDDAISALFNALSERFPELVAPLITERDFYLSWSLKRSKAVNGARAVVGCVGKGHMRGIVYALKHDQGSLRFKDLVGGKNNRQNRQAAAAAAAKRLLVELLLGAAAYAAWVAATGSSTAAGQ